MTTAAAAVRCDEPAWQAIEAHVFSSLDREVGGVLVGRIEGLEAVVTTALPALAATSTSANVTFTHEVWEQVHQTIDRDHADERIVGWYHSHPGFGVFLSAYDKFAHTTFFEDPALLALVVDPHSAEAGWFAMRNGTPELIATRTTSRSARPAAAVPAAVGRGPRRGSAFLALAAVAVLAFFAGAATQGRIVVGTKPAEVPGAPGPDVPAASDAPAVPVPPAASTGQPPPLEPVAQLPSTAALEYRVRRGDSFWTLSASFYGEPRLWPQLKAANPAHKGDLLEVGEHVTVPVSLAGSS